MTEKVIPKIHLNPDCLATKIITAVTLSTDFPVSGLKIIGNEVVCKRIVKKMSSKAIYINDLNGLRFEGKVLNVSGRGATKTIKVSINAMEILAWIGIEDCYMENPSHMTGSALDRVHRVAEAVAFFDKIGLVSHDYTGEKKAVDDKTLEFITSRVLKGERDDAEWNSAVETDAKTYASSRVVGAVIGEAENGRNVFIPVYNCRNKEMLWYMPSEFKCKAMFSALAAKRGAEVREAIMFGWDEKKALATVSNDSSSYNGNRKKIRRMEDLYDSVYFVPLQTYGVPLMKMLLKGGVRAATNEYFVRSGQMTKTSEVHFANDGKIGDRYAFNFLDNDLCRLLRFIDAHGFWKDEAVIICYEEQKEFLKELLKEYDVKYATITLAQLEEICGSADSADNDC